MSRLPMGTRSLLYGAHCMLLHPWFVAWAWVRLYGWPCHPAYWVAFLVHDLGYWGKSAMDTLEGEEHPFLGARIMTRLFDGGAVCNVYNIGRRPGRDRAEREYALGPWGEFALFHSRFLAKRCDEIPSRLCVADKLAVALTPAWLYLPMARLTGEIREYMRLADERTAAGEPRFRSSRRTRSAEARWYADVQVYMERWVEAHRDGRPDDWTPEMGARRAASESGVWR